MRGRKTSNAYRKDADIILVAARYEEDDKHMAIAQAYQRRWKVWSDVLLLDRSRLVDELEGGARVFTGCFDDLVADFEVDEEVVLSVWNSEQWITLASKSAHADDLGLPLF